MYAGREGISVGRSIAEAQALAEITEEEVHPSSSVQASLSCLPCS